MQPEKVEARNGGNHPSLEDHVGHESRHRVCNLQELDGQASKLKRLTDDLAAIADWKEELQRKIHLAQLKFELVDCFDTAEQEALEIEVASFKELCARLGETMVYDEKSEREAA